MTCLYCESPLQVVNGNLCDPGLTVVNHGADGSDEHFTYPPDPQCYLSPSGTHEDANA